MAANYSILAIFIKNINPIVPPVNFILAISIISIFAIWPFGEFYVGNLYN